MHGRLDRAPLDRGAVFLCTLLFAPPEQHESGTIRKHWNRTTEYTKTGRVQKAISEIHALVCGPKNCKPSSYHVVRKMSYKQENDCKRDFSGCQGTQSQCALCHERIKGVHSHPGQWICELQQFLLRYTDSYPSQFMCVQG